LLCLPLPLILTLPTDNIRQDLTGSSIQHPASSIQAIGHSLAPLR